MGKGLLCPFPWIIYQGPPQIKGNPGHIATPISANASGSNAIKEKEAKLQNLKRIKGENYE